ncbi:MAG: protein-L-isoaspartate(D-aspartate) O-methyltransferase [Thermodesulfobacteriota bacterium]
MKKLSMIRNIAFIFMLLVSTALTGTAAPACADTDFHGQRMAMVENQLAERDIDDPDVLAAFRSVKRHRFVPEQLRSAAYADRPLPIGHGQTISQPYIVAFMTEALAVEENDNILEIGTGSGYQAAILGEICKQVYTIEIIPELARRARRVLGGAGYTNVHVKIGDGYQGWPAHAPYDGIIVTCAPTDIPDPLKEQLADGGRMVIPVGETFDQELVVMVKKDGRLLKKDSLPVRFVPMVDKSGKTH